jgi:hypothetical protein
LKNNAIFNFSMLLQHVDNVTPVACIHLNVWLRCVRAGKLSGFSI